MSRNHEELEAFRLADALVPQVYRVTAFLPPEERFGLQSQIRRAAISVPTNLVEGCTRESTREYLRFVEIALGSAQELDYLLRLLPRLSLPSEGIPELASQSQRIARMLQGLMSSLKRLEHLPGA